MNLAIFEIVVVVAITFNRSSQHHWNGPQHDFGSLTHKLQIKATWPSVTDELNIK